MSSTFSSTPQLSFTEDPATVAYLATLGTNPTTIKINENGRIGFGFKSAELSKAVADMDSDKARVCPAKFAVVLRRVLQNYLSKTAKKRIKQELQSAATGGRQ